MEEMATVKTEEVVEVEEVVVQEVLQLEH